MSAVPSRDTKGADAAAKALVRAGYDAVSRRYRADDADPAGYRAWLTDAGFTIEHDEFVPEGTSGHQLFLARMS